MGARRLMAVLASAAGLILFGPAIPAMAQPSHPGDVDGDVDQSDLGALLASWDLCEGEPGFNAVADFDNSGCIDVSVE